jgi:hypothetical protein
VKSRFFLFLSSLAFISLFFFSCKKINESTHLGEDLLPGVDNIMTFQSYLPTQTSNHVFNDTSILFYSDPVAIGDINDPDFGHTHADAYFDISSPTPYNAIYPFGNKDSILGVDSVVLSLAYNGAYGDTNTTQTFDVFEIAQSSGFSDTVGYKFGDPDITTTGPALGTKTFVVNTLNDTVLHVRAGDTTKIVGVLRIPLPNSLGTRLINYDTTSGANGAYNKDSIFKTLFRGLAIKSRNAGNALTYFLPNHVDTRLIVYFRKTSAGIKDTTLVSFNHLHVNLDQPGAQADLIRRSPAGGWATYLAGGTDKIYIQSAPGSYATIRIPALDTFRNSVIHRAELIFTKIPSPGDNIFTPPAALFLDHISTAGDTAFSFDSDMGFQTAAPGLGAYDIDKFGGKLRSDDTYRFNITRYVQSIVTRKDPNHILRLFAPLSTIIFSKGAKGYYEIPVLSQPANGRVVLSGGNYADSTLRVRLRIVYSKI